MTIGFWTSRGWVVATSVVALGATSTSISGCSSIMSTHSPASSGGVGLVYYLPNRDFIVTVVRDKTDYKQINLEVTPSYADLGTPRVLNYQRGFLATNKLAVAVSSGGLLTSTKSTTVIDIVGLEKIGTGLGNLKGAQSSLAGTKIAPLGNNLDPTPCTAEGNHIFHFEAGLDPIEKKICEKDIVLSIVPLFASGKPSAEKTDGKNNPLDLELPDSYKNGSNSGVYYRMNRPYLLSVNGRGINNSVILFSPSSSMEFFLPINRTLFTNNDANIGMDDGVLKAWAQSTDSEIVGLLTLPAKILTPYFAAIGATFSQFKTNTDAEISALTAATNRDLSKLKFGACEKAIKDKDKDLITSLRCGTAN